MTQRPKPPSSERAEAEKRPAPIDADTDARLRLAAGLLIDSFLAMDSMKDNDEA